MKVIWILNHYATDTFFDHGGRHYELAKRLIGAEYSIRVFCASTVHNTMRNLISDSQNYIEDTCDGIPYVFIRARNYTGNGKKRILNMLDYYKGMMRCAKHFERPDIIIGSSVHPLAVLAAIRLGKKYGIPVIGEVRDLWPESFVAYGLISPTNPLLKILYAGERWIYKKTDELIFSMPGGRDYIIEKGWDKEHGGPVDLRKVHYINNGVDLEAFDYNKDHFQTQDADLDNPNLFKVVYTGSVRRANNLDLLLDAAKLVTKPEVRFIIYGGGDQLDRLKQRLAEENITNVCFRGAVEKKYVPGIVARSSMNIFVLEKSDLFRYGLSLNKSFDYLAAGRPMMMVGEAGYSQVDQYGCGIHVRSWNPEEIAQQIDKAAGLPQSAYAQYCENARRAAGEYDFSVLTSKLVNVLKIEKGRSRGSS